MNVAVFVSGNGSNLKAILETDSLKSIACVKAVFSDKKHCGAFEIASFHSIPVFSVSDLPAQGFIDYSTVLNQLLKSEIDLIILAGFLKLLPVEIVKSFKNKIINIHPALLPLFGGKGMYGMNVHKAVLQSGMKVSGATVHFVDEVYDNGLIIAQQAVDISDVDSPEEIGQKVLSVEHKLLPFVIEQFALNKIKIFANRIVIEK